MAEAGVVKPVEELLGKGCDAVVVRDALQHRLDLFGRLRMFRQRERLGVKASVRHAPRLACVYN